jgi:hypothetical protein
VQFEAKNIYGHYLIEIDEVYQLVHPISFDLPFQVGTLRIIQPTVPISFDLTFQVGTLRIIQPTVLIGTSNFVRPTVPCWNA